MTIVLRPEQEQVLRDAIDSGLAESADEALDQALRLLRGRVVTSSDATSVATIARRLATFGQRNGLSLSGRSVKDLLHESRP